MITDHRRTFTIDNMNDINQRHDNINVSEVMQYDYLYQQSMEKIEHKKKGIGTCLDGRSRKKEKTETRNRQPEDHVASLLRWYVWGWYTSFFGGGHTQIQCS
jgi:IS30 family transposase